MRNASTFLALALVAATGCIADSDSPDGADEDGLSGGKADGGELSACEKEAIVKYLNEGVSASELVEAGVHSRAAKNLVKHRDGADGEFGTDDDNLFDDAVEVDRVSYVGRAAFQALHEATADRCSITVDPYVDARDVTKAVIVFPAGSVAPTDYDYPDGADFDGGSFDLGGTEFWQRWSGGHSPTFNFEEGTDAGRLCMTASKIRWETIMREPPVELKKLAETTNWDGSFFNWNDDYSPDNAFGSASGSRLWAWQTYLMKWISQTGKDGKCYLPTREMVIRTANSCLATAASNGGEIQGCRS